MAAIILQTQQLSKYWGALAANRDLSLSFTQGCRHAIIGPNGAGKSTFIHLLSGALAPSSGQVFFAGQNITALGQAQRVRLGLARSYQQSLLFPQLTVLQSVLLVILRRRGQSFNWWRLFENDEVAFNEAQDLLKGLGLWADKDRLSQQLAYGQQRLLELALTLATRPKLLLLDEPAAGVSAAESEQMFAYIAGLPASMSIVLIEHDMQRVFEFAQRIIVLVEGQCFAQGSPEAIAKHPEVQRLYLGQ